MLKRRKYLAQRNILTHGGINHYLLKYDKVAENGSMKMRTRREDRELGKHLPAL